MKTQMHREIGNVGTREWRRLGAACLLLSLGLLPGRAATYTWSNTTAGSGMDWTAAGNWTANSGYPGSAGDVANVMSSIGGNQSISLNAAITLGTLNLGNAGGNFTIAPGAGSLTMDNGGSGAAITESAAGKVDTITAGVAIDDAGGLTLTSLGAGKLALSGGVTGTGNLILKNNGTTTGGVTLSGNLVNNSGSITNSGAGAGTVTISAPLGANVTNVTQNSATSGMTLSGANTSFAGTVTVTTGTLTMGSLTAVNSANAVAVSGGATFSLGGFAETIAGLNDVSGSGGTVTASGTNGMKTLTLAGGGTYSYAGAIGSSFIALALTGSGTQTLSGNNTYTGGTTLSSGKLKIANAAGTSATGSGAVTVSGGILAGGNGASGATTLGGASRATYAAGVQGIVSGPVEIQNGAHLAPGDGVGTITLASLALDSGAVLDFEFNGTANDLAAVTGAGGLTLNGGGFNLYQEGTTNAFAAAGLYDLLSYSGTLNGSIGNLSVLNQQAGFSYAFVNDAADGLIQLQVAAVPEPGAWALALGGLSLLLLRRRAAAFLR